MKRKLGIVHVFAQTKQRANEQASKRASDRCFTEQNVCSVTTTILVYIRNGLFVTKNYMFFENRISMFLCDDDDDDDNSGNNGNINTPPRTNLLSTFSYYITNIYGEYTHLVRHGNVCHVCVFFYGKPLMSLLMKREQEREREDREKSKRNAKSSRNELAHHTRRVNFCVTNDRVRIYRARAHTHKK